MSKPTSRRPLRALLAAVMIMPPVAVVASMSWLKQQPDSLVFLLTGIAATATVAASYALAILHDRGVDEWNRSNARFSSQWGWTAGACLMALLLALPPFRELIVSSALSWAGMAEADETLILLTFTGGFMAVVVLQLICTALLSMAWTFWKSRPAHEPS